MLKIVIEEMLKLLCISPDATTDLVPKFVACLCALPRQLSFAAACAFDIVV